MKKMTITLILTLVLLFFVAGAGLTATPPLMEKSRAGKAQTACPVMSGKINKDLYADYKGQRVYFCCPGCKDVFKKDPEAYLKKMREQG